jgi:site-specific DNA-adenine methylase
MNTENEMTTNALAGWYGSNRILAESVARLMGKQEFIAIPFAGGMCELKYLKARTIIVNDAHRHVISMSKVVADPRMCKELVQRLDSLLFHPDALEAAQEYCQRIEDGARDRFGLFSNTLATSYVAEIDPIEWAENFFVCCWMGRGGVAGTDGEFKGNLSLRWDGGGGDSNVRFRSAMASLSAWTEVFKTCNFTCEDFRVMLARIKDKKGHAIYADPPWVQKGDSYKHKFCEKDHRDLASRLWIYGQARVVLRYGIHPLIEELYPRSSWDWHEQTSRSQANGDVKEVLIVNRA